MYVASSMLVLESGMAPEKFSGGGLTRFPSMERSIREGEMTLIIQIYHTESVNFYAGIPPHLPLELSLSGTPV